ncbi:MAG: phosphoribosyl-AMP cyclohydrolase [Clostridiales bacterium]|nr:phosphoribosyl-AMP cyclohydrolase [Clostridiales bacterium]
MGCYNLNLEEIKIIADKIDFQKGNGLVPVIAQDYENKEVLMLAYMNKESFIKTLEGDTAWYFSRSRNELWNKGATSGHFQYVKDIKIDCDNDTILLLVDQKGAACHTGNRTCFYRDVKEI